MLSFVKTVLDSVVDEDVAVVLLVERVAFVVLVVLGVRVVLVEVVGDAVLLVLVGAPAVGSPPGPKKMATIATMATGTATMMPHPHVGIGRLPCGG